MSSKRQLAAIMFTDIVGYTSLMGKDSAKALALVRQSKEIQKPLVEQHHGKWLKEMGDGAMAQFNTALDAVNCAIEIQEFARAKLDAKLRIGIHLGDVSVEENDVHGDGVNVAARLESIAEPGGIYISNSIEKAIQGQSNAQTKYLGNIRLKNVDYEVQTYAIQGVGLPVANQKEARNLSARFITNLQRRGVIRASLVMLFFAMSLGGYWLGRKTVQPPQDRALIKYDIPLDDLLGRTGRHAMALSPDGQFLVYVLNEELNLKSLKNEATSAPIAGTKNARHPFFSPDGQWIGFENWSDGTMMKVQLQGGSPVKICDFGSQSMGINWYQNEIIFADLIDNAIYRVPDSGGTPTILYQLAAKESQLIANPQLLPDNKTLLFNQRDPEDLSWSVRTWEIGSNESPSVLIDDGFDVRFLKSGHIAFIIDRRLYLSEFNTRLNQLAGEPQAIVTSPIFLEFGNSAAQFAFSDNGLLAYYEQNDLVQTHLTWIDNNGEITPISRDAKEYAYPAISTDAQHIAVGVSTSSKGSNNQIEIINTKSGMTSLFQKDARNPIWSKDNSSIIYIDDNNQVFQKPINLSSPPIPLFNLNYAIPEPLGIMSSYGKYLPVTQIIPGRDMEIGYYDMLTDKVEMFDFYNTPEQEFYPSISPDGKWLAYASSDHLRENAIYVVPFPGPGPRHKVSLDRGLVINFAPIWAPDMKSLYYITDAGFELWKVELEFTDRVSSGVPVPIFNGANMFLPYDLDIHPDGDRLLALQRTIEGSQEDRLAIKVIVNWEQELTSK